MDSIQRSFDNFKLFRQRTTKNNKLIKQKFKFGGQTLSTLITFKIGLCCESSRLILSETSTWACSTAFRILFLSAVPAAKFCRLKELYQPVFNLSVCSDYSAQISNPEHVGQAKRGGRNGRRRLDSRRLLPEGETRRSGTQWV